MRSMVLALPLLLLSLATPTVAQSAPSEAQKAFETLKSLAGDWQGPVTTDSDTMKTDKPLFISMRTVSHGTAMLHEMKEADVPEVTMFYIENDHLMLLHYCDYQNRVLMTARPAADGKTFEFDFTSMSGTDAPGHVTHSVITIIDANHQTQAWIFQIPGQKPIHALMDLKRVP